MRILQITPYFIPAVTIGGTASAVYSLSEELIRQGHEVTVYTTDLMNSNSRIVRNGRGCQLEKLKIIYFANLSNFLAFNYHFFFPLNFFSYLNSRLKNFDIIHIHEIYTFMNLWAAYCALRAKIPYILTPHGTAMMKKEEGRVGRKRAFFQFGGRKLLENANFIIALSKKEKLKIVELGINPEKVKVIPNGVNADSYYKDGRSTYFFKKYNIPPSSRTVLFLGRIHPKKGLELLINALDVLKDDWNLFLFICGPVEDKSYADKIHSLITKKELQNRIFMTGPLEGEQKLSALHSADLFALTSYSEGLSLSLLEAASCALPLIVTAECGIPQIEGYKAGKIVDANVKSVAQGMREILSRKDFGRFYGENARKMVKMEFNSQKTSLATEKLYIEMFRNN